MISRGDKKVGESVGSALYAWAICPETEKVPCIFPSIGEDQTETCSPKTAPTANNRKGPLRPLFLLLMMR